MLTPTYKKVKHNGKEMTLQEWSKELGIPYNTLYTRLKRGYSLEKAFYGKIRRGNPNFNIIEK